MHPKSTRCASTNTATSGRVGLQRAFDVVAIVLGGWLAWSAWQTIDSFAGLELAGLGIDSAVKYQPILAGGVGLVLAGIVNLLRPAGQR